MLFGRRTQAGSHLALIIDIESGSVGAALARGDVDGPAMLHEERVQVPVRPHRGAEALAADTLSALGQLLPSLSERALGEGGASTIAVFFAPPWGTPNLTSGAPDFVPHFQESVRRHLRPYFSSLPSFYTNVGAMLGGLRVVAPYEDSYLVCIVTHEMTELLLVKNGAVAGHATFPHGINLPLRTLRAHGGLSEAEARSLLRLHAGGQASLGALEQPLRASTEAFAGEFFAAGRELFEAGVPERVWVVSPMGEHFARALSHHALAELFPAGGTVAALRPEHATPHMAGESRDLFLTLEALFVRYS